MPGNRPDAGSPTQTTNSAGGIVLISIFLALALIVMGIRFYTRQFISRRLALDDLLILVALLPTTIFAIASIVAFSKFERIQTSLDMKSDLTTPILQLKLGLHIVFDISTTLTKLSMLALIYRVEQAKPSYMRYVVIVSAVIIALNSILFVFITAFQCNPASDYWTPSAQRQNCIDEAAHLLAAGTINTITDLLIVLIPIRTVMGLNLPKAQRVVVYVLFAGGCLAGIAGAVRTYYTWLRTTSKDGDTEWGMYYVVVTSSVELFVGIICASIPATRPFFVRCTPRRLTELTIRPSRSGSWFPDWRKASSARGTLDHAKLESLENGSSIITLDKVGGKKPVPVMQLSTSPGPGKLTAAQLNKPLPEIRMN